MRYLPILLVTFLTGCPVPPKTSNLETAPAASMLAPVAAPTAWPVVLPPVEVVAPRAKDVVKPKPVERNPCVDLDVVDVEDAINQKLDCLLSPPK
ncbi:hypothetical protein C8R31_101679 [Nitrosospira sp. Nsp2]|uniref:hypothetical protein n=1 Tax=Nitrosospira sp. Nsp2 TaxID=136548 RepID=UPI000D2FB0BD|nr:hypothetical protein [Nitrosospira sp. Nsp2]PTR17515.1 hypothetical protein C8R31_101679 [Nitrosospira sp. Nsp2]